MIIHNDKSSSEFVAECYEKYEQKIYRLAYSIIGDAWQAEETVQETFIKVIRHRDMLKRMTDDRKWGYISKIAKSVAIDMYRKNKKNSEVMQPIEEDKTDVLEKNVWDQMTSSGKTDMTEQIENREIICNILSKLSDEDAMVLKLRFERQLSVRETAAIMQMAEPAVRKKCERAVKRARKLLVKEMMLDGE